MKTKTKTFVILLIIGLVFPLILDYNFNYDIEEINNSIDPNSSGGYIESFIHIDGSIANNWTDTLAKPWCNLVNGVYVIENVTIDASSSPTGSGIYIENSKNEYFIIRNCTVYSAGNVNYDAGIKLENVNNGTLTNNNCLNNLRYGISLLNDCNNNTISGNTASDNGRSGIYLKGDNGKCHNNTISGNTANNNIQYGIYLIYNCDYNNITGNTANDNEIGIYLDGQDGATCYKNIISGNTANGNIWAGIYLIWDCDYNTILGNTANLNNYGIILLYGDNNKITGNTANDNHDEGFFLQSCDKNDITENTANNNYYGMDLNNCNNNDITGNTACSNTGVGIFFYDNCHNDITENTANDNDYGIYFDGDCDNNTILGNHAFNNTNEGISLVDLCDINTITENVLYNNTIGIHVESNNNNNSIYKNFFLENGIHAIDDGTDNNWNSTTIGNYWDNWTSPDTSPLDGIVDVPYAYIGGSAGSMDFLPIAEDGAPMITINSPSSGSVFGVSAPSFDVTIVDTTLASMWYTLDGGLHNFTFTENGIIDQSAWDALLDGSVIIRFYAIDIVGNVTFEEVSVIKNVQSGLDPGVIIAIVIVSIVGGVALIAGIYVFMKKRVA